MEFGKFGTALISRNINLDNHIGLCFRYKAPEEATPDDPTADYMNLLGMVFSMLGLMMKVGDQIGFFFRVHIVCHVGRAAVGGSLSKGREISGLYLCTP